MASEDQLPPMDGFEFNKIAGAVLATALVVFGLKELSSIVYHAEVPETGHQGFAVGSSS